MAITTTRFDASEYLDAPEDHIELLNEALATNDPRVIIHAIGVIARSRGMTDLAKSTNLGRSTLYKAIADDANPTIETLMKVLDGLGLDLQARVKAQSAAA